VDAVLDVRRVPQSVPRTDVPNTPSGGIEPTVVQGSLPEYPEYARTLGLSGEVQVRVTVDGGAVIKTEALSGNAVLSRATIRAIKSWVFEPDLKTVFVTTFVYRLQMRLSGEGEGLLLEARLPYFVRISAPADCW
jgi:TonB family protein